MIESSKKTQNTRMISPEEKQVDWWDLQNTLRPQNIGDYVGQELIKKHLIVSISSAKIRSEPLDHLLFYWPPGLGKTTISNIIATEMWSKLRSTSWPAIEKQSDLVSILSNLEGNDILFIDEIHRLRPQVEEILYTAMEDYCIDIMVWSWTWAQSVKMPLKPFTLIGATTRLSSIASPLRDRFGNVLKLDFYSAEDLQKILQRNTNTLLIDLSPEILLLIAKKSRGTPRIANRLLKIVRDYYTIWKDVWNIGELSDIFREIWIDEKWLDYLDRRYLEMVKQNFAGWPVGLSTIAASIWEEESTLEDVVEPYLLQIWFIERTPRWRKLTPLAIEHLLNNR